MTVVPDDHLMKLICDNCGDVASGPTCVLPDAEVVWTFVSEHGWTGSPFATGPHHCPRCALTPSDGQDRAQEGTRSDGHADDPLGIDYLDEVPTADFAGDAVPDADHALRAALTRALDLGGHVVVDLAPVSHIDPAGLGLLVRAYQEARRRGKRLCLAAPSRFVLTVLHTMRLDGIFPVFDSRREALVWLSEASTTPGRAAPTTPDTFTCGYP